MGNINGTVGVFWRAEFPRPDWIRRKWVSLCGEWEFQEDGSGDGERAGWHDGRRLKEKINVPFCVESKASGICRTNVSNIVWYKKRFTLDSGFAQGGSLLLNFGAVDYRTKVWLNGKHVGGHEGGFTPFRLDVTNAAVEGENVLSVQVYDTHDPRIPRGKQTVLRKPFTIFYTTVTGIWQPVWLESTGGAYLKNARIDTSPDSGKVTVTAEWTGGAAPAAARLTATMPNGAEITVDREISGSGGGIFEASFSVADVQLWSLETPELYPLKIEVIDSAGAAMDCIETYFAFRTVAIKDKSILLNGKPFYQKLLLNQGYFPEGHFTPVDPAMFRTDIEQAKAMGFNGVRMHQKVEDPRFLFWADALGFFMWDEMPSALCFSEKMRRAVRAQWAEVMQRDRNHPCVVTWAPFNESWGVKSLLWSAKTRAFIEEIYLWTKKNDPTRPVTDNSGFEHVRTDILDIHHYLGTTEKARAHYEKIRDPKNLEHDLGNFFKQLNPAESPVCALAPGSKYEGQPMFVSEYGGFGFYKTQQKPLIENFGDYTLDIARCDLFQGFCYTQQYDTEQEQNGLLTFDRKPKEPLEKIRAVNDEVDRIVAERESAHTEKC